MLSFVPADVLGWDLLIAGLIATVAGLTKGYAGFGGGMIMAPLLAIIYGPAQAVAMIMVLEFLASLQLFPRAARQTDWRLIGPLALLTCLLTPVGLYALLYAEPETMRRFIGAVVLALALIMLSGWRYRGEIRPALTGGVGVLAGLLMGATGLGGPPVILYVLSRPEGADRARAGMISYFAIAIVFMIAILSWRGVINELTLWRCVFLGPWFMLTIWAGSRLFRFGTEATFRKIALSLLVVAGLTAIVS
jgi:hypothetical protein